MKNKPQIYLIICTALFAVLVVGTLLIRHTGDNAVSLSALRASAVTHATSAQSIKSGRLDINTATAEELTMLPGIGEVLAQRIVEYRTSNGRFQSKNELLNVKGIGNAKLNAISDYITVGGK